MENEQVVILVSKVETLVQQQGEQIQLLRQEIRWDRERLREDHERLLAKIDKIEDESTDLLLSRDARRAFESKITTPLVAILVSGVISIIWVATNLLWSLWVRFHSGSPGSPLSFPTSSPLPDVRPLPPGSL